MNSSLDLYLQSMAEPVLQGRRSDHSPIQTSYKELAVLITQFFSEDVRQGQQAPSPPASMGCPQARAATELPFFQH